MDELPVEKHPPYPENDHLFGKWMPYGKNSEYRICMHPDCHYYEKREVKPG